jgi:NAD(P)H dehydrogenase (quinone)
MALRKANIIAVTGATGEIGRRVAIRLSERGITQRFLVRDPARAPQLPNATVAQIGSYADAAAMGRALKGVKSLFLVSAQDKMGVIIHSMENKLPIPSYDRVQQHIAAVSAAAAVGVESIVYLSFVSAAKNATFILSRDHFHTEEFIRSTGIKYTFLRQNLYMDKVPLHIARSDVIRAPAGKGRVSWVSRDDIADAAVNVLTGTGHDGNIYDITGPEALTMEETAQHLSAATGRNITYQPQTPQEARLKRNTSRMEELEMRRRTLTGHGLTDYEVEVWISHYLQIATGEVSMVSDTVPLLCKRPGETLAQYLNKQPVSYGQGC